MATAATAAATAETPFEFRGAAAAAAAAVALAGSWNGWAPAPMARVGDGAWVLRVALPPGAVRFKFVVDGEWVAGGGYDTEDDGHGGENCVLVVAEGAASAKGVEGEGEGEAVEGVAAGGDGTCVVM